MKSAKPTTYLTADELKKMASIKQLDAESGPSGARRIGLLEEAIRLEAMANVKNRRT
jgi:hypothetical protein